MYVTRVNEMAVIDMIPMEEIHTVISMNDDVDTAIRAQQASHSHASQNTVRASGSSTFPKGSSDLDRQVDSVDHSKLCPDVDEFSLFSGNANLNNILQVQTSMEGMSAGRTLYFSTRNGLQAEKRRQAIVSTLSAAVKAARRKSMAMSRFQKSQAKVLAVQSSMAFQIAMAVLIMLVISCSSRAILMTPMATIMTRQTHGPGWAGGHVYACASVVRLRDPQPTRGGRASGRAGA
jgi:hypothetical protein